ncbi:MAG: hypothetical protein ACKN9T_12245 [Candidatus Methylumidiphilus sp.]
MTLGLLAGIALPISSAWAHGGASVDTDQCRIFVGPHLVHFTAYQPQLTGSTEFCGEIPELGTTTMVFDYEGKALRNMTVEVEFTKEPEGTRIAYLPPATHASGTFNTTYNFTEASKYLAHVTLINEGVKIDAHVAFKVGTAKNEISSSTKIIIATVLVSAFYLIYLSSAPFKAFIDGLFKKKAA